MAGKTREFATRGLSGLERAWAAQGASACSRPTMPGGVHGHMRAWDPEEDRLIIEMLSQHGPRWAKIVKELPGRTISSVRNRWQRIDRGRRITRTAKCLRTAASGAGSLSAAICALRACSVSHRRSR